MAGYTKLNLKDEVEDQAPNFGLEGKIEARMARVPLELEQQGVSYQRIAPNFRVPFGHRHKNQEEVYIVISGSLLAKVEDEVVELRPFDALRVHRDTMRGTPQGSVGRQEYSSTGVGPNEDRNASVG